MKQSDVYRATRSGRWAATAIFATLVLVGLLNLVFEPQGSLDDSGSASVETPSDAAGFYSFVGELAERYPQFDPKVTVGVDTRSILAVPADDSVDAPEVGPAWKAPAGGYRSDPVVVPTGGIMRVGLGFANKVRRVWAPSAEFAIDFEGDEGPTTIFQFQVDPVDWGKSPRWLDLTLDLAQYGGRRGSFVFRASSDAAASAAGEDAGPIVRPVWAAPVLTSGSAMESSDRPNIVIISVDTLRADHLGCYGYARATTPNVDALAEEGVLFEKAFASTPWTLPSHATLLSGLRPLVHRATIWYASLHPRVSEDHTMLAERARQAGYRTAAFTEGGWVKPSHGFAQGFDRYNATLHMKTQGMPQAELTFSDALNWVRQSKGQPFFLFAHTYQVHMPYAPPGDFAKRFQKDSDSAIGDAYTVEARKKIRGTLSDADKERVVSLYDGEIAYTDSVLGTFFDKLKADGVWENSLVLVLSDHGEEFWEHGKHGHRQQLYDESIQIPLIVKLPGGGPVGLRIAEPVALSDVYATICELAGWDYDGEPLDSVSVVPLINGEAARYAREYIFAELGPEAQMLAVRAETMKYVKELESERLFDLMSDPGEVRDIADGQPGVRDELRGIAADYLSGSRARRGQFGPSRTTAAPVSDEEREQLEALGYLE